MLCKSEWIPLPYNFLHKNLTTLNLVCCEHKQAEACMYAVVNAVSHFVVTKAN